MPKRTTLNFQKPRIQEEDSRWKEEGTELARVGHRLRQRQKMIDMFPYNYHIIYPYIY
jgi:hypothetical protein